MMKKYMRSAALMYTAVFIGFIFWWMMASGQTDVKRLTIEGYFFEKEPRLAKAVYHFHTPSGKGVSNKSNVLKSVLTLGPEDSKDKDQYIFDIMQGKSFCNGSFIGYAGTFAKLTNVVINPTNGHGRRGGENLSEVLNQPEEKEYFNLDSGYFKLKCTGKISYTFNLKSHVSQWLSALNTVKEIPSFKLLNKNWTIAIKRYEYVNLYHTMTDFYNAFLIAKAFKMQPGNITILWIDGHPFGTLDITWETLFGTILRAGDIQQPSMFSYMIWGIMGYDSPLNNHNKKSVPYLEEFRTFFLSRHGIPTKTQLNCTKLKIMFLWRRDYVAHPRNPSGSVSRKIKNENELLKSAQERFVSHDVFGIQIDKFVMKKQLEIIANTDILIGMHGAGLSHTLFLPKHAGLIELYPTYWSNANKHFKSMARWRSLHYLTWNNIDRSKELPNHYTLVDVETITDLIGKMKQVICD